MSKTVPDEKLFEQFINANSLENGSNTPDFILGQFFAAMLTAYNTAIQQRETWYGRDARPIAAPASEGQGTAAPLGVTVSRVEQVSVLPDRKDCRCSCHTDPNIMHIAACCNAPLPKSAAPDELTEADIEWSAKCAENPKYRQLCALALDGLKHRRKLQEGPVAWMIELADSQYPVDSLDDAQAVDDLTNHDAKAIPLYALKAE